MKKTMKTMLGVALLIASATLTNAKTHPEFTVSTTGEKQVNVHVEKVSGKANAFILDENENVIKKIRVNQEKGIDLKLDFSKFETGNYQIVFEDDLRRRAVPVTLEDDSVLINEEQSRKIYFPQLVRSKNSVLVKLISDEENDLSIDIKDTNGSSLFKDELKGKNGLIGMKFEFEPGQYVVTLKSREFTRTQYLSFK